MATIRSYTTIKQSRKLAEILPIESADMHYCLENRDVATGYEIGIVPFIKARRFEGKCNIVDIQPAWSLAALLDMLSDYTLKSSKFYEKVALWCKGISVECDNPVDACVAMIEELNKLKML